MKQYSITHSKVMYALLVLLITAATVAGNTQQTFAQAFAATSDQNPSQQNGIPETKNQGTAISEKVNALTPEESAMVAFINQERSHTGLAKLEIDPFLVGIAREKSRDMVRFNYFGHMSERLGSVYNQLAKIGFENRIAAENLAGAFDCLKAGRQMLLSPAHRSNILNPHFKRIGIGIVKGGPFGMMITEVFIE